MHVLVKSFSVCILAMLNQVKEMIKVSLDVIELGIIYFLRMSLVINLLVAILLYPGSSEEIYHNNLFFTWWTMLHYGIFTVVMDLYRHCDDCSVARAVFFILFSAPLLVIVKYDASMVVSLLLC